MPPTTASDHSWRQDRQRSDIAGGEELVPMGPTPRTISFGASTEPQFGHFGSVRVPCTLPTSPGTTAACLITRR
jgi:hypothetical protein